MFSLVEQKYLKFIHEISATFNPIKHWHGKNTFLLISFSAVYGLATVEQWSSC